MTLAYDAQSNSTLGTGTLSWTHTPSGTPAGALVQIIQDGSSAHQITGVTYGGTAMTASTDVQNTLTAGRVYTYFLGSSVPTGAQTVEVTVSGSSLKVAGCVTVTGAYDIRISDTSTTQGTLANPTVTVTVGTGITGYVVAALHSAESVGGDLSVGSGTTQVLEQDFGAQHAGMLRRNSTDTAGDVTVGWTDAVAEDSAIVGVVLSEAVVIVTLDIATETDESRTLSAQRVLAIDIATETDVARNMANYYVPRATETDTSRAILPFTANWPAFSGTRTFIPLSTSSIDSTLSGASSGTVFVLTNQPRPTSTGIEAYTWTSSLPAGVTLRGNPVDAVGQSVTKITQVVTSTVAVGDDCTLRDMFLVSASFSFSGKAWFEHCVMENTVTDAPPSSSSDYVIFSRCTFISTGDIPLFDDDGVSAGGYYFYDCLFLDNRTSGTSPLIKTFAGDITFVNCTFSTTVTDWLDAAPGATGAVTFTNCVFAGEITDITSLGGVSGSSNWGVTSPALSIGQTTVTNLYLDDSNYWRLTPTNQSPFRAGGTTTARTHAGAMTLDRDCLPYAASIPSAGCFQWKPSSSCLYKARSSDPLDGFEFTYGANTLDTTYLSEFSPTLFKSHLDVAAVVRSYVWDLIHPARGYFYTAWDGYYRLFLHAGQFDLTTASPSSKIFGATTLTAEEDTG